VTAVKETSGLPRQGAGGADRIELVDLGAEAQRSRIASGSVLAMATVEAALASYFRVGNLNALRELALQWLADSPRA
jgi:two-component system sensor histidine kinase KdpD